MRIYVASSWRNLLQPGIVHMLKRIGHEVYDFRNPYPGYHGFSWREIDTNWMNWTPQEWRKGLEHPVSVEGYKADMKGLDWCDVCVLVLPAGRSASFELGYAMGKGKKGYVIALDNVEPELMFLEATILCSMNDLFEAFGEPE